MNGDSHCLVANFSMACLSPDERHILYPRWGGIEAGATLSDQFRIMWEPIEPGSKDRQLVHRCFATVKQRPWLHHEGTGPCGGQHSLDQRLPVRPTG